MLHDRSPLIAAVTAIWSVIGGMMGWLTEWANEYSTLIFVIGSIVGSVCALWQVRQRSKLTAAQIEAAQKKADYYSGDSHGD